MKTWNARDQTKKTIVDETDKTEKTHKGVK